METFAYESGMTAGELLAVSCCILILLCVAFLILMDGVRLYSGWPTRGLFFLAIFGADALFCSLLDAGALPAFGETGRGLQRAAEQMLFLWMPFLLMIYYARVVRAGFRKRMLRILWFNAGLAAFLTVLFFVFPKERIVTEVYTLFLLALSAAVVVMTLLQWHGGQRGYRRIYWESTALLVLFAVCLIRFAGKEREGTSFGVYAVLRIAGIALFMLIMTVMQFYAILMEYRTVVERTTKQLEEQNADLIRAREEAEDARREAEDASEAKSAFLTRMYHEIRTPVNAVLGMDEMILRETKDARIRGYATDIYTAGQRIQTLVDDAPTADFEERIARITEEDYREGGFCAPHARLLVVDDNAMNRRVFRQLLKDTQAQIAEASGGRECLELVEKEHFDLIFLDHMMPEMDGVETLREIRRRQQEADYPCRETPVWVLTANAVAGARETFLAEGFDGFLAKPIVTEQLEEILRTTLPPELLEERRADRQRGAADAERTSAGEGAVRERMPEDLPAVDGLDWSYAWLHLPGEEMLAETLRDFHELLPVQAKKLEGFYTELPGALDDYRIQVHGMKSAAATVGIVPLAGMANALEYAARDGRIDAIQAVHPLFLETWRAYREKLAGVFGIGEETETGETADPETLRAMLLVLRERMEEMDVDAADQTIAELKKFRYDEAGRERLQRLSAAVTDLDGEAAAKIIDAWMEELG